MRKKVLLLGASGMIAPNLVPGLEDSYDLTLADVVPHPDGKPILHCDVSSREQVRDAAAGMDAIMNFFGRARSSLSRAFTSICAGRSM